MRMSCVESPLVPAASATTRRLEAVRREALAAGVPAATAAGLVAWLVAGGDLGGGISVATRTRYRAILRELGEGAGGGD